MRVESPELTANEPALTNEKIQTQTGVQAKPTVPKAVPGRPADIQADGPVPAANGCPPQAGPENAIPGKPKRVTGPRRWRTIEEIDAALTQAQGNRRAASEVLKISVDQLKTRIHDDQYLRAKWNRKAVEERLRLEARAARNIVPDKPRLPDLALQGLMDATTQMMNDLNTFGIRKDRIEKRIDLGEAALAGDLTDPKVQRHAFRLNMRGDPTEEKMLREHLIQLTETRLRVVSKCLDTFVAIHKIDLERQAAKGGIRHAKPGFGPKGTIIEMQKAGES